MAILFLNLTQVHAGLWSNSLICVNIHFKDHVRNAHDVSIGVFYNEHTVFNGIAAPATKKWSDSVITVLANCNC